jgi:hypothetical protein
VRCKTYCTMASHRSETPFPMMASDAPPQPLVLEVDRDAAVRLAGDVPRCLQLRTGTVVLTVRDGLVAWIKVRRQVLHSMRLVMDIDGVCRLGGEMAQALALLFGRIEVEVGEDHVVGLLVERTLHPGSSPAATVIEDIVTGD